MQRQRNSIDFYYFRFGLCYLIGVTSISLKRNRKKIENKCIERKKLNKLRLSQNVCLTKFWLNSIFNSTAFYYILKYRLFVPFELVSMPKSFSHLSLDIIRFFQRWLLSLQDSFRHWGLLFWCKDSDASKINLFISGDATTKFYSCWPTWASLIHFIFDSQLNPK